MPFAKEFDDVYVTIRQSILDATPQPCRCFRLDDLRPAGRISDRLVKELQSASFCVADLTGNRPNVMWEVGYAMALKCPTILVTQSRADIPFDIGDMQSLEYDRTNLSTTLGVPLRRMVVDTLSAQDLEFGEGSQQKKHELVGQLLTEVAELKGMLADAVRSWSPRNAVAAPSPLNTHAISTLEGAWKNVESGSHMYARVVRGTLIAPYCYGGDDSLIGVYYNWRKMGDYWFARYAWINGPHTGFTFLRHESVNILRGAWWGDESNVHDPAAPPKKAGVPADWQRLRFDEFPDWALEFLKRSQEKGFLDRLLRA